MKVKIFLLFGIVLVVFNLCQAEKVKNSYVNDEYKYSIDFPEDWIIEKGFEKRNAIISYSPESGVIKDGISIFIEDNNDGPNLELAAETNINSLIKSISDSFFVNNKGKVVLNNREFYLIDCSIILNDKDLPKRIRSINYVYLLDKKICLMVFLGEEIFYEKNRDIIIKSIESFKFL